MALAVLEGCLTGKSCCCLEEGYTLYIFFLYNNGFWHNICFVVIETLQRSNGSVAIPDYFCDVQNKKTFFFISLY